MAALDLAIALSSGLPWLGIATLQSRKVAVVSREDSPGMTVKRLREFAVGRGVDIESIDKLVVNTYEQRRAFSITNDGQVEDLCKWAQV